MSLHDDVLATAKRMLQTGLVSGTSGNVSARLEDGTVCITPSSVPYDTMTLGDLTVIDMEGNQLSGEKNPSSEWQLHTHVYQRYDEIGSVIHCHPVNATMFAVTRRPIPPVIDEFTMYVGGEVPVCDYAPSGTPELADNAADKLEQVGAALLANHGMVVAGPSLDRALHIATLVERAAGIVAGAEKLGELATLPQEVNDNFVGVYKYFRSTP